MRKLDPNHLFDMLSLEQTLYDYCHELDAGAARVTDYFTEDCVFVVGESTWRGHAGLRDHYAADAEAVRTYYEGGVRTVRHGLLNVRSQVRDGGEATVELIFLNFSAGGAAPFLKASAPTVVADTRLECRRDDAGFWRIREFYARPLYFGDDPYLNTVLREM
jgi:hypothetical protein